MAETVEGEFVGGEASQHGSVGEEGEELEAELAVGLDLRGEYQSDGGELGTPAAMEEHELGRERKRTGEQGRRNGSRWGSSRSSWSSWRQAQ